MLYSIIEKNPDAAMTTTLQICNTSSYDALFLLI